MPARFWGLCCLLFGLAAFFVSPATASEPRVALVIGNSDYGPEIGKLLNPANDARLMADTLKGLGFSVDLVLDADQKAMKRAIKAFGAKLEESGKDTTGLFYYAGHGVQVDGTNFLLPVGAEIEREADVEIESISADDVMTQMQFAGNAVNLVFLDACRNNPLAKANRSGTRGLARLDAPRGSFVGYSTAPGDVAADGDGANSPYALALADELKKPGISVEEAHRNVRARVLTQTGNKQTPWDSSSLTGAVILAARLPEAAPAQQPQQQAAVDKEVVFWESIKGSSDPADFEAYLAQYPQGTFVPLAKNKITALKAAAAPAPEQPASSNAVATVVPGSRQISIPVAVEADIADYLQKADEPGRWSALAMTADGSSVKSAFCNKEGAKIQACIDGIRNNPTTQAQTSKAALKACGGACILLYEGVSKNAGIELKTASVQAPAQPSGESASALPPSSERMIVSADAQRQIDEYLRNTSAGGRYWALAISNDGRRLTAVSCPKTGNSGPRGCREGPVASQNITNELALKTCGVGCQLLYVGKSKVAEVELVQQ